MADFPSPGTPQASALAQRMYDEYTRGAAKSAIEEEFLGSRASHGKQFSRWVRRELGIETETAHPLVTENEGLRNELAQLRLQFDLGQPARSRASRRPGRGRAGSPSPSGAMRRFTVTGFRSLMGTQLEPQALTGLIGPNASGKSNLFSALELLQGAVRDDLEAAVALLGGSDQVFAGHQDETADGFELRIEYKPGLDAATEYRLEVGFDELGRALARREFLRLKRAPGRGRRRIFLDVSDGEGFAFNEKGEQRERFVATDQGTLALKGLGFLQEQPQIRAFREYIEGWTFLAADIASMKAPTRDRRVTRLDKEASDVGPVLRSLERDDPEILEQIVADMKLFSPTTTSLRPDSGPGGLVHVLVGDETLERELPLNLQSDGFLFFLATVVALRTSPDEGLVVIEEPEHGVHPYALQTLVSLFREVSERTQVVFTTHSPNLIDYMGPEEVATVAKIRGKTTVNRLSRQQLSQWLDEYSLGELWERQGLGDSGWSE